MDLIEMMRLAPVVPVLTIEDPAVAVPLAQALVRGGLRMLEVTLRTPAALDCIARIAAEVPEAVVGAGMVLTAKQLRRATRAGALFAASPGFSTKLSGEAEIPLLPGVATASEIMKALEHGHDALKLYPAELAGGVKALPAFLAPFPMVRFCPAGGIGYDSAPLYLSQPNVVCVSGSWVAPDKAVADGNWEHIELLAHEAAGLRRHQDIT